METGHAPAPGVRASPHPRRWDPWPLARLCLVAACLLLQARLRGWEIPWDLLMGLPARVLVTGIGLFLLSSTLGRLYAFLWTLPILLAVLANDCLYSALRRILACCFCKRRTILVAALATMGEVTVALAAAALLPF